MHRLGLIVCLALAAPLAEPVPRKPTSAALKLTTPLTHVSAAHELRDGRVVLTNAKSPSVLVLDPRTGATTPLGSAGAGPDQYARPGGLYAGPNGSTLLLDRGLTRLMTISTTGTLHGTRSIAQRGTSSSSDADVDLQRVDARGFAYFANRHALGESVAGQPQYAALVRFDPEAQKQESIAQLRQPDRKTFAGGDGMVFSRSVVGSPEDGWGVASDGRIAIVRADPYRVEWLAPDGKVTSGPVITHDPLPMTDADRQAFKASTRGPGVLVGSAGDKGSPLGALPIEFAAMKPPFKAEDVIVSPDARVWVLRTRPLDAREVIYDLFDGTGRRVDRFELPAGSRIVGFGPSSIYVRHIDEPDRCELRKYLVR